MTEQKTGTYFSLGFFWAGVEWSNGSLYPTAGFAGEVSMYFGAEFGASAAFESDKTSIQPDASYN